MKKSNLAINFTVFKNRYIGLWFVEELVSVPAAPLPNSLRSSDQDFFFKKWHLKYDVYHVIRKCQPIFLLVKKSTYNCLKYICKMIFKNRHLRKLFELRVYRILKKSLVMSRRCSWGYSMSWKVNWIMFQFFRPSLY